MRLGEYERNIAERLAKAGVDSPRLCARLLCANALGLDKLGVLLQRERQLDKAETKRLEELANRRASGEPLAHIIGKREFFSLEFGVSSHTLVPRPETELLVETALEQMPEAGVTFADIGAGSGCIGISLAFERPKWCGVLLEKSGEAIEIAGKNALALLPVREGGKQLVLIRGDLFASPLQTSAYDLVVSNPPYIGEGERSTVMDEVLLFEPSSALFSPQDGLAHLAAVAVLARRLLRPLGLVVLEHGARQGAAVRDLLAKEGFSGIRTRTDLAGLERCTFGKLA